MLGLTSLTHIVTRRSKRSGIFAGPPIFPTRRSLVQVQVYTYTGRLTISFGVSFGSRTPPDFEPYSIKKVFKLTNTVHLTLLRSYVRQERTGASKAPAKSSAAPSTDPSTTKSLKG